MRSPGGVLGSTRVPMLRLPRIAVAWLLALIVVGGTASAQQLSPRRDRAPWGTGQSRPEDVEVTLVTFGPGPSLESWFGHSALVVEDTRLMQRRLYNYGMFDFGPQMWPKFAAGRLEFWVDDTPYVLPTYRYYASESRDVILQRLNLPPEKRLELARALDENVQPENRYYLYHHYFDNCSTRPRDMIDKAIGGALHKVGSEPSTRSLRQDTERFTAVFPPMSVLLDFLMNDEIDKPIARWDEAFLPSELEGLIDRTQVTFPDGSVRPLVAQKTVWFQGTRPKAPENPPAYGLWLLLIGVAVGGCATGLSYWAVKRRTWLPRVLLGVENLFVGLVFGLPGTVLLLMWLFTGHTVTHRNENLLLANPLTLLAVPFGLMLLWGSKRAVRWLPRIWVVLSVTGILAVLIKPIPVFDQDNWRLIALILPISLGFAAASVMYERSRRAMSQRSGDQNDDRPHREDRRAPSEGGRAPGDSLTSTASGRASR